MSRRNKPITYTKRVIIPWDLTTFVKDQALGLQARGWDSASVISLTNMERAITITGSAFDAQAMACGEYLEKTWPEVGRQVLHFVKEIANESQGRCYDTILKDGTKVLGSQSRLELNVTLIGNIYAIAEIAEILGWLSSAFQPTLMSVPQYCMPKLVPLHATDSFKLIWITRPAFSEPDPKKDPCWYKMFNNPMIVDGYPIARREEHNTGVEVSTAIIDALMQRPLVNVFDNKLYVKSFSAMLIPTGRNKDLVKWHYVYKNDGNYLDFLETDVQHAGIVGKDDLMSCRHVVGWCPQAKFHTGAPWKEGYSVKPSKLPVPSSTVSIKGFSLTGNYMGVGFALPILLGLRDPPTWIEPNLKSPERKIGFLARVYMILWDTEFLRGWLVDGPSVLLHLVRASLKLARDENESTFHLDMKKLLEPHKQEPVVAYPEAAKEFFKRDKYHNLNMTIFEGFSAGSTEIVTKQQLGSTSKGAITAEVNYKQSSDDETVNDEFLRLWSVLAHTAYLTKLDQTRYKEGINIRLQDVQGRPYLIGWDFDDVLVPAGALERKMTILSSDAEPWVELIRSTNAITLFGKGFGQLIEPGPTSCANWKSVPRDMHYLAAGRYIIQDIIDKDVHPGLNEQIRGILPVSGRCQCKTAHLHTIKTEQVLKKRNQNGGHEQPSFKGSEGAIIFGSKEPKTFLPDTKASEAQNALLTESSNTTASSPSPVDAFSMASNMSTQITSQSDHSLTIQPAHNRTNSRTSFFGRFTGKGKGKDKDNP